MSNSRRGICRSRCHLYFARASDHFCPRTLDLSTQDDDPNSQIWCATGNEKTPIPHKFENIIELSHRESMRLEVGLQILRLLVADPSSSDSLLIVSDDLHTVLDQNDCIPTIEDQNWIGQSSILIWGCCSIPAAVNIGLFRDERRGKAGSGKTTN